MIRRFATALFVVVAIAALTTAPRAIAAIRTCDIHNGMKVWFLDYAHDDYTNSHPLGVLEGVIDIDEHAWHAKCKSEGPNAKVFVPFNYRKNNQALWDTRWPQDVYRTRAEAQRAYQSKL